MIFRGYKASKLKSQLKMAVTRFQISANKKSALMKQQIREIAQLLAENPPKEEKARIKAEALIRDDNTVEAYEILQLNCDLLSERISLITHSRTCPPDLVECISTLIWASAICDIPELEEIRKQFRYKYGKEFEAHAMGNVGGILNQRVTAKLSVQPPSAFLVQTYLEKIADQEQVSWKPAVPLRAEDMGEPTPAPKGDSVQVGGGSGLNPSTLSSVGGDAEQQASAPLGTPSLLGEKIPPAPGVHAPKSPGSVSTMTTQQTTESCPRRLPRTCPEKYVEEVDNVVPPTPPMGRRKGDDNNDSDDDDALGSVGGNVDQQASAPLGTPSLLGEEIPAAPGVDAPKSPGSVSTATTQQTTTYQTILPLPAPKNVPGTIDDVEEVDKEIPMTPGVDAPKSPGSVSTMTTQQTTEYQTILPLPAPKNVPGTIDDEEVDREIPMTPGVHTPKSPGSVSTTTTQQTTAYQTILPLPAPKNVPGAIDGVEEVDKEIPMAPGVHAPKSPGSVSTTTTQQTTAYQPILPLPAPKNVPGTIEFVEEVDTAVPPTPPMGGRKGNDNNDSDDDDGGYSCEARPSNRGGDGGGDREDDGLGGGLPTAMPPGAPDGGGGEAQYLSDEVAAGERHLDGISDEGEDAPRDNEESVEGSGQPKFDISGVPDPVDQGVRSSKDERAEPSDEPDAPAPCDTPTPSRIRRGAGWSKPSAGGRGNAGNPDGDPSRPPPQVTCVHVGETGEVELEMAGVVDGTRLMLQLIWSEGAERF